MRLWPILAVVLPLLACRLAVPMQAEPTPTASLPQTPAPTRVQTPAGSPSSVPAPAPFDAAWDDRSAFRAGLATSARTILDDSPGMSVYHLDLAVADDLGAVTGQEQVLYTNTEPQPLNEVQFRLFPNLLGGGMTVNMLQVDGKNVEPRYELGSSLMVVPLATPLQPGEQVVIGLQFAVSVPTSLEQNYGVLSNAAGVLAYAHGYPMIAVFDQSGWNAEIPPEWGDLTFADASYYLVRITAPKDLQIATSGSEISRGEKAGRQEIVAAAGPARDFQFSASSAYKITSRTIGEVTLRAFVPPGFEPRATLTLDAAEGALSALAKRYGPYPYTELDLAVTPTYALGIEYPGLIVLNQQMFTPEEDLKVGPEETWLESTVAHEVAHQWFYNLVGNDQLDQPWLDESLAQFATWEYFRDGHGSAAAQVFEDSLEGRWSRVGLEAIPLGMPVRDYEPPAYSAIIYGRGPLFLEALRSRMGGESFDSFMRDYFERNRWKIATTEGFRTLAERDCDCDLGPLFEEWVYP